MAGNKNHELPPSWPWAIPGGIAAAELIGSYIPSLEKTIMLISDHGIGGFYVMMIGTILGITGAGIATINSSMARDHQARLDNPKKRNPQTKKPRRK